MRILILLLALASAGAQAAEPYNLGSIPARFEAVEFADEPSTSNSVSVSNQTELNAALVTGNRITVDSDGGPYTSISITGGQTDIDIVMEDRQEPFSGGIVISNGTRIRITGGDFNGGWNTATMQGANATHVILDDVDLANGLHLDSNSGAGGPPNHITVLNSTITNTSTSGYGILGDASHVIVANTDISNTPSTQAGIRMIPVQNMIIADSRIFTSGNRIIRIHAGTSVGSDLILVTRTQLESDADHNIWLGPTSGVSTPHGISRVEFHDNTYYVPQAGIAGGVMQTDTENGGGIDDVVYNNNDHFSPDSTITGNPPTNFSQTGNTFSAYTTPPEFLGGAGSTQSSTPDSVVVTDDVNESVSTRGVTPRLVGSALNDVVLTEGDECPSIGLRDRFAVGDPRTTTDPVHGDVQATYYAKTGTWPGDDCGLEGLTTADPRFGETGTADTVGTATINLCADNELVSGTSDEICDAFAVTVNEGDVEPPPATGEGVVFDQNMDGLDSSWPGLNNQGDSDGTIGISVNGDLATMSPFFDGVTRYVASGHSARFFVTGGISSHYRSEVALSGYNRGGVYSDAQNLTHWIGFALRLDAAYPTGDGGSGLRKTPFIQLHRAGGQPGRSPMWELSAGTNGNMYVGQEFEALANQTYDTGVDVSELRGRWSKIVLEIRYETTATGYIRWWFDDELVFERLNIVTMEPDTTVFGYYKVGLYPSWHAGNAATSQDKRVWIDNLKIADAAEDGVYESVEP